MIWPRAAIVAEIAWSNPKKDWPDFSKRLVGAMARWQSLGLNYDWTPLEVQASFTRGEGGLVQAKLRQPAGIGTLLYSIGAAVSPSSRAYEKPLVLKAGTLLEAQSFADGRPLGKPQRWQVGTGLTERRTSSEMELCSNSIALRLEDDGPTKGVRKVHWADIMHPCWIWRAAPLDRARRVRAIVGRLPFNFSIGEDIKKISYEPPATPAGELKVRMGSCEGPVIATVPLESATKTSGVSEVTGPISAEAGTHDLCMTFTGVGPDPFWVLDSLALEQ
jgi:hexosaminidase